METNQAELLKNLEAVRREHGDDAYNTARKNLALLLILQPRGEEFLRASFPDLDLNAIREEAQQKQPTSSNDMLALIRMYLPHLKTQMQYEVFTMAFEALMKTLDNFFAGTLETGDQARDVLTKALDAARKVAEIQERVAEIPQEQRSVAAASFVEPPKAFTEVEDQRRLLAELDALTSREPPTKWYIEQRARIDRVVTPTHRNELFDAIRNKQQALLN